MTIRRFSLATLQITVVGYSAVVVYQHDIHNIQNILPYIAIIIFKSWTTHEIQDPVFGNNTLQGAIKAQLKKLAPKRQLKRAEFDV